MKPNFHPNQIFYIKDIGYARVNLSNTNELQLNVAIKNDSIQTQNEQVVQSQQQCVLFDPDMFNIEGQSSYCESNEQTHLSDIMSTRKLSIERERRASTEVKVRQTIIIPMKLQQTNAMVYCPQLNLMKKITLKVKPLLQNKRKQIVLNIEIIKTIDNLKNLIFKQLNQQIGYYSDIRIFTTVPLLSELNIGTKTLWQYGLKDKSKLNLIAKFNFTFKNLPQNKNLYFALTNGNNTLANIQLPMKKQQPATSKIEAVTTNTLINVATQTSKSIQQLPKTGQQVNQSTKKQNKQQTLQNPLSEKIYLQCTAQLRSGIHYWQFKIDKLNMNSNSVNKLIFGVCLKKQDQKNTNNFQKLWAFDPLRCRKIQISSSESSQNEENQQKISDNKNQLNENNVQELSFEDESDEQYGSLCKNGDLVGVFLTIKETTVSLIFYKNSVCLNQCYQFDMNKSESIHKKSKKQLYFCPFINLSGQIQITLDSKATCPLDSNRFK